MKLKCSAVLLLVALAFTQARAQTSPEKLEALCKPLKAPKPAGLQLMKGDRLAICGDSITEQKMYSRIMEDYLTMCVPELEISVRQYGWGGERAGGFLARMTNDCLRFKPTIATTCYGMNDHEYRAYEERVGQTYREKSEAIVEAFKANGVRVIQGSPGCIGKVPGWTKHTNDTVVDLNANLCHLRNIGIEIAENEQVGFADVFWPMLTAGMEARQKYGPDYAIAGKDGVHPGWAGHAVMAYAFLKAMGLKGEIGTFTVDLKKNTIKLSEGHELVSSKDGEFEIKSSRYPFCECAEPGTAAAGYPVCGKDSWSKDSSIHSGAGLVSFDPDLNRLMLVGKGGKAQHYTVIWAGEAKTIRAEQLARGVNLVELFPNINPFCQAFGRVDGAVAAKQAFETKEIKELFRSSDAKNDMEGVASRSEQERAKLVAAIKEAFVPVVHRIRIEAVD
ncbi:MAG: hypothetical protein C5B50_28765 [Verrucomicrobia bacterium]|nr:MAG: hypothetical protein C5B50_28765 [Verrucomicrobiota bacterium]